MIYALLIAFTVLFAFLAIRAKRLIASALWLAVVSALLAVIFYSMGAQLVAVIELSIGAGLVTVLFVFAISIACLLYTSPSPRDRTRSRMPSSA